MHNNKRIKLFQDHQSYNSVESYNKELFFEDGKRQIDFILVYVEDHDKNVEKGTYLKNYVEDLRKSYHLEIEEGGTMNKPPDIDFMSLLRSNKDEEIEKVHFLKIHAPMDVLYNVAEEWKVKKATTPFDLEISAWYEKNVVLNKLKKMDPFVIKEPSIKVAKEFFALPFDRDRITEFHNWNNLSEFFSSAERSRMVYYLLELAQFSEKPTDIGISNLIYNEVLLDAYPLHDGPLLKNLEGAKPSNSRQRLQKDWATPRCLFKYQPLDLIRDYFGEKIALYFSWLGYYTAFLVVPAILGISVFIYGIVSAEQSEVVKESCSSKPGMNGTYSYYMCPLCDKHCSYFLLNTTCMYSKITHFFDNEFTLIFTVFMCLWSTVFIELWKRYQIELAYKWHTHHYKKTNEPYRPEFIASNVRLVLNPVTGLSEPYMPPAVKFGRLFGATSVVLFFICLVVACVVGVVVFRAILAVVFVASQNLVLREAFVAMTAGGFNLLAIQILKFFLQ